MKTFLSLLVISLLCISMHAQKNYNELIIPEGFDQVVVILPTGEKENELPVMTLLSDTSALYKSVEKLFGNSYLEETLKWYFLAENYLKNTGQITQVDPAYFALTQQDGGFAKIGFYLKNGDELIAKPNSPYVDIVESRMESNQNKLMSVTQLYPHELGHMLYGMLNSTKFERPARSVDMHYFSLRTDYSTAFNEGFSEHIENISRLHEPNDSIRKGIQDDLEIIGKNSPKYISGFERDMRNPVRMGYYKISMPVWFQKYEDWKRHEHAFNGTVRYANSNLALKNIEDQLTYRNAGLRHDGDKLKNYVQMLSTEGVISAFLTELSESEASDIYQDASFYKSFLIDSSLSIDPQEVFTPTQNQFIKYFFVFNNYMTDEEYSQAQLIDFIEGYIAAFPEDKPIVLSAFKKATNLEYTSDLPPDLWLMVKNHHHRLLALDAFDAITLPVYTFDLNAAEEIDLLTIKGLSAEEAKNIVEHRNEFGFFSSLEGLSKVEGLSEESLNNIMDSKYDNEFLDELKMPNLTLASIISTPLKKLLLKSFLYFILIFLVLYFSFFTSQDFPLKRILLIGGKYLLFWILLVVSGLMSVVVSTQAWAYITILILVVLGVNFIIHRKNRSRLWRAQLAFAVMGLLILGSVF